jgi:hypothetical protein
MSVYEARPLKRVRATKAEMGARYAALVNIINETAPTSVRHAYYGAITQHLIEKDTAQTKRSNYGKIQRGVLRLRRASVIDYADIVDNTRWMRKPESFSDIDEAVMHWHRSYRRDLWASNDVLLEVWCESESIAGVLQDVTFRWDVPLLPCKGYSSETFAYNAAANWLRDEERTPAVLYVGDLDLHGKQIEADLRRKLEGFYGDEVEWHRVGLTEEQVEEHGLEALATKSGHWEAEALPPDVMRRDLESWIEEYVTQAELTAHKAAEKSEREILDTIIKTARGAP